MLHDEYLELSGALATALPPLSASALFLPPLPSDGDRGDCFGILFLSDGSAGPFYVALDDALARLQRRCRNGWAPDTGTAELLAGFASGDPAERALALGVFNAMSQSLMRRAGFTPGSAQKMVAPLPGETIGMVGFFGRLARPWSAAGVPIRVLELEPTRVEDLPGISLVDDPAALAVCDRVVCTSSVLVNQTLDDIIAGVGDAGRIELVGPSGSGLPDIPLARGVRSVGGVYFAEAIALSEALRESGHWGKAGMKYTLDADGYPGFSALAAQAGRAVSSLRGDGEEDP